MSDIQKARDYADQKQFRADVINYNDHKHYNIDGEEAEKYLIRLFEDNFPQLHNEAMAVARKCAQEMAMAVIGGVCDIDPALLDNFRRPNLQAALLAAEESFAQTGDPDTNKGDGALGLLLSRLVVKLAVDPKRSLREIALRRAIATAPNLTREQINALSVLAVFRSCTFRGDNPSELLGALANWFEPYYGQIPTSYNEYSYMESQGVGANLFGTEIYDTIIKSHGKAVTKRFLPEEIPDIINSTVREEYLETDPDFPEKLLVRPEKAQTLLGRNFNWRPNPADQPSFQALRDFVGRNTTLSDNELKNLAAVEQPALHSFFEIIEEAGAQHFQVNTIGFILAKQELDLRYPGNELLTNVTDLGPANEPGGDGR